MRSRLLLLAASIFLTSVMLFMASYHAAGAAWAPTIAQSDAAFYRGVYWLGAFAISAALMVVSLLRVALYHRQQRLLWAQFDRVRPDKPWSGKPQAD